MKVIIAGSRSIQSYDVVKSAVDSFLSFGHEITEVVSGKADGVDTLGEVWAVNNGIPVAEFPAAWDDTEGRPLSQLRRRRDGSLYWVGAGYARNRDMALYADALIAVWNGSGGTKNMISEMRKLNKLVYVLNLT